MTAQTTARLAGILWAVSFFLSLGFLPSAEPERLASTMIGIAAVSLLVSCGGGLAQRKIPAPRISFLVMLFWVLAVISTAWSVAPFVSLIYLGMFTLLPATILAVLFATEQARREFLIMAITGTGLIVAGVSLWALVQVFLLPEYLVNGQVRNPFGNPNAFAALLGLSFFAGFGLYLKEEDRTRRRLLWAGLFLVLCAFSTVSGKAATLALAAGLAIFIPVAGRYFLPQRWKPLLALMIAVLVVSVAMSLMPNQKDVVSLMAGMLTGETGSITNRIDIWNATLKLIAANPLFGTGYRTFYLMYPSVRLPADVYSSGFMVHSDPLQFWAELGILGPVLFYAIGIGALLRFLSYWRNAPVNPEKILVLSLFLGCAAFVAHSHVDFHFYTAPTMLAFGLAFPVLLLKTGTGREETMPLGFMADWTEAVRLLSLLGPILALIGLHGFLMMGEYYTSKASRQIRDNDVGGFAESVNIANEIGFGMNARPYTMAATVPLSILKSRMPGLSIQEQQTLFLQTDRLLDKALQRNSRLAPAWHHRGDMRLHLHDDAVPPDYWSAEESFRTALEIDPLNLHSRLALAGLYEAGGRKQQAFDLLLNGIHWPYPVTDPQDFYSQAERLARELGKTDALPLIAGAREYHDARVNDARRRKAALDRMKDDNLFIP